MSTLDYLNKPLSEMLDDVAEAKAKDIEQKRFEKSCMPVISFDYCIKWALSMKKEYPQSAGCIIGVKNNPDPRNENYLLCVIICMIDAQNKVISMDGKNGISTVFHGKTVDKKMLDVLNGNENVIYKF